MKQKNLEQLRGLARQSVTPEYAQGMCEFYGVEWKPKLVYTKLRYRESADEQVPRVDGLELIEHICSSMGMTITDEQRYASNKFYGEGSRRQCLEDAWLGKKTLSKEQEKSVLKVLNNAK